MTLRAIAPKLTLGMAKNRANKKADQSQPATMTFLPADHEVIEQVRERFGLQGLPVPQLIRVALRRLLEETKAA